MTLLEMFNEIPDKPFDKTLDFYTKEWIEKVISDMHEEKKCRSYRKEVIKHEVEKCFKDIPKFNERKKRYEQLMEYRKNYVPKTSDFIKKAETDEYQRYAQVLTQLQMKGVY